MRQKNYWKDRKAKSNFLSGYKRKLLNSRFVNIFYPFVSVRLGDEKFIKEALSGLNRNTILDIACGAGKDILVLNSKSCIGIDIEGYPSEEVYKRGYKAALVYSGPDYFFKLDEPIDIVSCINLNAHIPFESLEKILNQSFEQCRKNAHLLLVNEYYGGYTYEKHFKNTEKRNALINKMEHYYFESEDSFLNKLGMAFPNLKMIHRKPLTTMVSSIQYKYYFFKDLKPPTFLFYIADFFISIFNYILLKNGKKKQTAFLMGYVYKIN